MRLKTRKNVHNSPMKSFAFIEKITISPAFLFYFVTVGSLFILFYACFLRKNGAFFSCAAAFYLLFILETEFCYGITSAERRVLKIAFAAELLLLYALFLLYLRCVKIKESRRAKFEAASQAREYVLPERGNGYVRDKLREVSAAHGHVGEENTDVGIEVSHACSLLKRLKKCNLALSDRIEVAALEKRVSAYNEAPTLTANEIRELSDSFCCILKLSAKYLL